MARNPVPALHVEYFDLPSPLLRLLPGQPGVHVRYHLWQIAAVEFARELHGRIHFDIGHHLTYARYWAPSFMSELGLPYLWGPVGGGDTIPPAFRKGMSASGRLSELVRDLVRRVAHVAPRVRRTARRSAIALAATSEAAGRVRRLGARDVRLLGPAAVAAEEIDELARLPVPTAGPIRFVSVGRLLQLKGFHLGLEAFARARTNGAEYWVIGDGPERRRLEMLATALQIRDRVRFTGFLPRAEVLRVMAQSHALVHPSLRDAGGLVVAEALAAGRPVICVNTGGPPTMLDRSIGFAVSPAYREVAIAEIAAAMELVASDSYAREAVAASARTHAEQVLTWRHKAERFSAMYDEVLSRTANS